MLFQHVSASCLGVFWLILSISYVVIVLRSKVHIDILKNRKISRNLIHSNFTFFSKSQNLILTNMALDFLQNLILAKFSENKVHYKTGEQVIVGTKLASYWILHFERTASKYNTVQCHVPGRTKSLAWGLGKVQTHTYVFQMDGFLHLVLHQKPLYAPLSLKAQDQTRDAALRQLPLIHTAPLDLTLNKSNTQTLIHKALEGLSKAEVCQSII